MVKKLPWRYAHPLFYAARYLRTSWHNTKIKRVTRDLPRLREEYTTRYGVIVNAGPFKGMRYVTEAYGSTHLPKLIGCYEDELHQVSEELIIREYLTIINVGCDESYYAVGLSLRVPNADVYVVEGGKS